MSRHDSTVNDADPGTVVPASVSANAIVVATWVTVAGRAKGASVVRMASAQTAQNGVDAVRIRQSNSGR